MSDLISQVVVIGDLRKFVSVLVTVAEDQAKRVAAEAGEAASSYGDAARSKRSGQGAGRHRSVERDASVVRDSEALHHLDRDFSIESGELTPTQGEAQRPPPRSSRRRSTRCTTAIPSIADK